MKVALSEASEKSFADQFFLQISSNDCERTLLRETGGPHTF